MKTVETVERTVVITDYLHTCECRGIACTRILSDSQPQRTHPPLQQGKQRNETKRSKQHATSDTLKDTHTRTRSTISGGLIRTSGYSKVPETKGIACVCVCEGDGGGGGGGGQSPPGK